MQILFLTKDQYKEDYEISNFNHKQRFMSCADKAKLEVIISSWNNIVVKNGSIYIKRGITLKNGEKQQIKRRKKIEPIYINNHVNSTEKELEINKYNLETFQYLLKKKLITNNKIEDDAISNIYIEHLINNFWKNSFYSYHDEIAKMGKWYLEKYFKTAEEEGIKASRPKTVLRHKDELIKELEEKFLKQKNAPLIIKPHGGTRSEGIYIVSSENYKETLKKIAAEEEEFFICQEYLDNTVLYNNKKADIRIHVAVLSWDPIIIKVYREGWIRMSNKDFNPKQIDDLEQSISSDSMAYKNGGGVHFVTIDQYFNESFDEAKEKVWKKTEQAIKEAVEAIIKGGKLTNKKNLTKTIYFFGFDLMFGKEKNGCKPYILEVNHFPDLYRNPEQNPEDRANAYLDETFIQLFKDIKKHTSSK